MNKKNTEVSTVNPTAMSLPFQSDAPAYVTQMAGGRGSENVGAGDVIIPRLEVIQALSPARKKGDSAYIDGAEEGMLFNNVTRVLYGTEVFVIPVAYKKQWLLWKDRKLGGGSQGFRGAFDSEAEAKNAASALGEEGVAPVETAQHFCLAIHTSKQLPIEEIVISMSKSKLKVSKRWNSLMRIAGGDTFSRVYKVSAVTEKNARNEEYYNMGVSAAGWAPEEVYRRAEKLYDQFAKGGIVASHDYDASAEVASSEEF